MYTVLNTCGIGSVSDLHVLDQCMNILIYAYAGGLGPQQLTLMNPIPRQSHIRKLAHTVQCREQTVYSASPLPTTCLNGINSLFKICSAHALFKCLYFCRIRTMLAVSGFWYLPCNFNGLSTVLCLRYPSQKSISLSIWEICNAFVASIWWGIIPMCLEK
jgi:hypothetical protein